jgi:hypothetical protein
MRSNLILFVADEEGDRSTGSVLAPSPEFIPQYCKKNPKQKNFLFSSLSFSLFGGIEELNSGPHTC